MTITARVFMSGRSQALRLPAKLRLNATQVRIERLANGLWLQPEASPDRDMGQWLQRFYATTEALPDDFLAERQDPPPQERDWGPGSDPEAER
jgi:antitoxin VapB